MLALALVAALAAFAVTQKPKGKGPRSPFTNDSCTELVDKAKLERWAKNKLKKKWEQMLAEGYDALPDEDTEVNLLVATNDLLRQVLPAGCFDADTDAYMDLFRMTWCAVQVSLAEQGRLEVDLTELLVLCGDEEYDPRSEVYTDIYDDETDAGDGQEEEYDEQTGDPLSVGPDSAFVQGTSEPCSQLVPSGVLVEWATLTVRPAFQAVIDNTPDLSQGLAADQFLDHNDVLEITDIVLEMALGDECEGADTEAMDRLYRWVYCLLTAEMVSWDWIPNVNDPHEVIFWCDNAPADWDPRDEPPWWHVEQQTQTAMLQTNPARGRTGRTGQGLRVGRTGQGGLRCANPGGMMAPNVSVSDVILTGQMLDSHCPGSTQHPCLDDDNRIVYPQRSNPARPAYIARSNQARQNPCGPRRNPCGVGACG